MRGIPRHPKVPSPGMPPEPLTGPRAAPTAHRRSARPTSGHIGRTPGGLPLFLLIALAGMTQFLLDDAVAAQGFAVMPLKGQSAKQVATDQRHCLGVAAQRSGHDPTGGRAAKRPSSDRARDVTTGAVAGADAAGAPGRKPDARSGSQGAQAFDDAFRACLGARGYAVE